MNATLHKTAHKRAKTARAGAFAQLAGGGAPLFADAPVARLRTVFRKDFGLLTADFANRPLSEVRCLLPNLKQTARKGNNREGKKKMNKRNQTWKAAVSAAAIAASAMTAFAATNITENVTLTEDTDWTEFGTVTLAAGATVNLNGHSLAVKNIDGAGAIADIPGYQRLEYIEATGNQYIDTEDQHNASTIVDIRIQFTSVSINYQSFYGARSTSATTSQFGGWLNNNKFRYGYGNSSAVNYNTPAVTTAMICDVHLNKSGACTVTVDGTSYGIGSGNSNNSNVGWTDFLFTINQNAGAGKKAPEWWTHAKMFSCVIQQDGAVAHNFIPARRMSDGMVGMYDSVTGKFHVSPNGNKFVAGPAKSKLRLGCGDNGYAYDFSTSTLDVDAGIPVSFMESGSLAADCDMRKFQDLEIESGATIDLAGHKLYVSSISGSGKITDSVGTTLSGFERIEYLQASGTQYIDTGYIHDNSTKVDMRIKFDSVSQDYQSFYGARNSKTDTEKGFSMWLNYAKFRRAFGGSAGNIDSHTVSTSTIYDIHLDKSGACTATPEGGEAIDLGSGTQGDSLAYTDYLFAINQYVVTAAYTGWKADFLTRAKLYSCKIFSGTTLARDFVPVRRTSDGVLGLLDLAHGTFYTNAGTGSFSAGETIVDVVGGELHVVVADGGTGFCNVALTGGLKVVKEGEGTLLMDKASQTYFGGTEIAAGVLKSGAGLAQPCGVAGGWIVSDASGTVDFNGNANMQMYHYDFADGAKALNGGAAISSGAFTFTSFYTPVSTGAFTASLADGATLDLTEWDGAWPISGVTAPAGATVTVKVDMDDEGFRTLALSKDAETGKHNGKLLSFGGARPADTTFVPDAVSANRCRFIADENGDIILTFRKGFVIIIK